MSHALYDLGPESLCDLAAMTLGEPLGRGVDRRTFVSLQEPGTVIKVQVGEKDFQNIAEYALWHASNAALREWLAPVRWISRSGRILLMQRCEPCPKHLLPKKVPRCLEVDFHRGNVGLLDGRPVCFDYGRHTAIEMAANAARMVRPRQLASESDKRSW